MLLDPTQGGYTMKVAGASEAFQERRRRSLEPALLAAVTPGDVRSDVPPPNERDGSDEDLLDAFLLPAPRPVA